MTTERVTVTHHTKARPIRNVDARTHGQTPEVTITVTYDEGEKDAARTSLRRAYYATFEQLAEGGTE